MPLRDIMVLLVLLAGVSFAQSAEESCSYLRPDALSCYKSCCESNGFSWDPSGEGACLSSDDEYPTLLSQCGYCTDEYLSCMHSYEAGGPGGYPSGSSGYQTDSGGSGCCSGFVVLALLASAAFAQRA